MPQPCLPAGRLQAQVVHLERRRPDKPNVGEGLQTLAQNPRRGLKTPTYMTLLRKLQNSSREANQLQDLDPGQLLQRLGQGLDALAAEALGLHRRE